MYISPPERARKKMKNPKLDLSIFMDLTGLGLSVLMIIIKAIANQTVPLKTIDQMLSTAKRR